nr:MAG: ORF1 [TTV-like mini virus]
MPWWRYRYRRPRWRRYRRRFRAPIFRRFWRRRWVRRRRFPKKLKKLKLKQFQPRTIHRCKIKGPICLFQTTNQRLTNDFDLYENSLVPEHLPGGGGWGIKVFTLNALYAEHEYCRNIWTKTNANLPLVRYLGASIKFYQSPFVDYCVTYSNELPMQSSLGMYNAMQPSIHSMLQHKLLVPSTKTYRKKRPYFKFWVGPPTQLQNKWYFQQDLAKTPLLMVRTTAMSLNQFYIDPNDINSNMNITTLNIQVFQNREFKLTGTKKYWAKKIDTKTYWLYASREAPQPAQLKKAYLIPLIDTMNFTPGKSFYDVYHSETVTTAWETGYATNIGNPFYPDYLNENINVYLIDKAPQEIFKQPTEKVTSFAKVNLTNTIRYNPYSDTGKYNICYFKSNTREETNWLPPDNTELTNENLPFWLLLWGFSDWHKKIKKHLHIDTDYILTLRHKPAQTYEYLVPLSTSFLQGKSPYEYSEEHPTGADLISWYPQFQYQQEIVNDICRSGPGTAKLPDRYTAQALMRYTFHFKWGGSPAPMSTIEDPKTQPTYIMPGNKYGTNSLQNPTSDPENILWSFDERRQFITSKALKRLQKDKGTEKTFIAGGSHFQEYSPQEIKETSETSSEEEEETSLFEQLQRQRLKQHRIKQRILKTIQQIQNLE